MLKIIFWIMAVMVFITLITIAVDEHSPAILFSSNRLPQAKNSPMADGEYQAFGG